MRYNFRDIPIFHKKAIKARDEVEAIFNLNICLNFMPMVRLFCEDHDFSMELDVITSKVEGLRSLILSEDSNISIADIETGYNTFHDFGGGCDVGSIVYDTVNKICSEGLKLKFGGNLIKKGVGVDLFGHYIPFCFGYGMYGEPEPYDDEFHYKLEQTNSFQKVIKVLDLSFESAEREEILGDLVDLSIETFSPKQP